MKFQMSLGIALAVAVAATGAGWMILPSLQASDRTVTAEAAEHVERARRLMQRYDPSLERKSILLDALFEGGVDVDVEDPDALADAEATEYENEVKASWAAYQPMEWQDVPRKANPSFGNVSRDMKEAASQRDGVIRANRATLDKAFSEVDAALSLSGGDAGRSSTEANRLKGMMEYHRGLTEWHRAEAKRRAADRVRASIIDIGTDVAASVAAQMLVEDSGIEEKIRSLRADETKAEESIVSLKSRLNELDEKIAQLKQGIADATAAAAEAESEMHRLREIGAGQGSASSFAESYAAADQAYRAAQRLLQSFLVGDYTDASVRPVGDFLEGTYEARDSGSEPSITFGLVHFSNQRSVVAAQIGILEQGLEDHRAGIRRLDGVRAQFGQDADRAKAQTPALLDAAAEAYEELNRLESEAFAFEEDAIGALDKAAQLAQEAARNAQQDASMAGDRLRHVPIEHQGASAQAMLQKQRWIGGHIEAGVADAGLAKAWIYYQRFASATRNAEMFTALSGSLQLAEADIGSEQKKAKDAHDAGVAAIASAMKSLRQAHKSTDRQWTIVAQEGAVNSLMALFGHPDYLDDAIAAYRSAVGGREDQPAARPFVEHLRRLESE